VESHLWLTPARRIVRGTVFRHPRHRQGSWPRAGPKYPSPHHHHPARVDPRPPIEAPSQSSQPPTRPRPAHSPTPPGEPLSSSAKHRSPQAPQHPPAVAPTPPAPGLPQPPPRVPSAPVWNPQDYQNPPAPRAPSPAPRGRPTAPTHAPAKAAAASRLVLCRRQAQDSMRTTDILRRMHQLHRKQLPAIRRHPEHFEVPEDR
ncbi:MAG: hypothetical protein ACI9HE_004077, partial [Planctomycetota bacterium]